MDALLVALATGAASGFMTWGALRVELRYLRRDIDLAHARIDKPQSRMFETPTTRKA